MTFHTHNTCSFRGDYSDKHWRRELAFIILVFERLRLRRAILDICRSTHV